MPSDLGLKAMNSVHRTVLKLSGGRLRNDPNVEVALGGEPRRPMVARVADGDERARLWPLVTADHKNYAGYQTRTDREVPLVLLLEPAE
jgi:F420H(2)-dependent quinone reductase